MDRIRTDTDSDISDNHICVSFQFPSLRMETDRIRTDTNSNISDIFEYPFSYFLTFPSLLVINQSGFRGFTGVYLNLHLLPSTRCACFYEVRCYYYGIYLCVCEIK